MDNTKMYKNRIDLLIVTFKSSNAYDLHLDKNFNHDSKMYIFQSLTIRSLYMYRLLYYTPVEYIYI